MLPGTDVLCRSQRYHRGLELFRNQRDQSYLANSRVRDCSLKISPLGNLGFDLWFAQNVSTSSSKPENTPDGPTVI